MSSKNKKLSEWIDAYVRGEKAEFTFKDLVDHLRRKGVRADEDEILDFMLESEELLETDCLNEIFQPRHVFFEGAQFRITPLAEEVEGGYLVPGHRFFPFASYKIFPPDAQFVLPDGSNVPTRTVSMPFNATMPFLLFYGPDSSITYLVQDHAINQKALMPSGKGDVQMTVFDLSGFYAESGFKLGDSLMLTVVDWQQGVFSITHAEHADMVSAQKWVAAMDQALDAAVAELETDGDCYEQMALTMRNNAESDLKGISLMKNPPLAFSAYYNLQKKFAVAVLEDSALFWDVDQDPAHGMFDDPQEFLTALDRWFEQLGMSVSEGEAEAYMRDALYLGGTDPEAVLARLAAGRSLFFPSAETQQDFHDLWNVLWDETRADYSREADTCGDLRSRFLGFNDRCLAVMRTLDASGVSDAIFKNPAFMEFSHLTAILANALILLNIPGALVDEVAKVEALAPVLEQAMDDLIGRLSKGIRVSDEVYQLKVSLKGAKPPIWRRILVPASMELPDLHLVIQAAMGWEDCHLHQFKQGRTHYQLNPEEGMMMFGGSKDVDSTGVQIGDLLQTEKQKISYEYDFGDSWEHDIVLEKILDSDEGQVYPACIKGKGACPPEDCGGLWGYYAILEEDDSFCDPETIKHYRKNISDPTAFDLTEANARLKSYFD